MGGSTSLRRMGNPPPLYARPLRAAGKLHAYPGPPNGDILDS